MVPPNNSTWLLTWYLPQIINLGFINQGLTLTLKLKYLHIHIHTNTTCFWFRNRTEHGLWQRSTESKKSSSCRAQLNRTASFSPDELRCFLFIALKDGCPHDTTGPQNRLSTMPLLGIFVGLAFTLFAFHWSIDLPVRAIDPISGASRRGHSKLRIEWEITHKSPITSEKTIATICAHQTYNMRSWNWPTCASHRSNLRCLKPHEKASELRIHSQMTNKITYHKCKKKLPQSAQITRTKWEAEIDLPVQAIDSISGASRRG